MKRKNLGKKIATLATVSAMIVGCMPMNVFAYGEEVIVDNTTFRNETDANAEYQAWKNEVWDAGESADSGKIALTPGNSEEDLNFAWYAEAKGLPAVKVWKVGEEANETVYRGTYTEIDASNVQGSTYEVYNHVSIKGYFEADTQYKYQYTDNYTGSTTTWSDAYDYSTADTSEFSVIVTGDPQVGASGSSGQGTADDKDIARDTYNWNKTMNAAMSLYADAALLLSVGDQVDYAYTNTEERRQIRESEYAGYLYPGCFRSLPIAATIGNHDTNGVDYSQHFNNPNADDNLGWTEAGSDFYFSYGDVLFICLNSNNRNQAEHRALMENAVASNPDAKWRIAYFHIDIYGSSTHSDTDATANRIIFAPLMDEFDIDICLTGHDHTYSRSYQMLDGNVIDYDIADGSVTNPEGTLYVTTGSASGSKYYDFVNYTQYYLADRTNVCLPTFSALEFTEDSVTIKTYDYNGEQYADNFTIVKTDDEASAADIITRGDNKLAEIVASDVTYTEESLNTLKAAIQALKAMQEAYTTADDAMIAEITLKFRTADDRCTPTSLDGTTLGYGHIKSNDDKDSTTDAATGKVTYYNRFKQGLSTLLDKTLYIQNFTNVDELTEEVKANLPIVQAAELEAAKSAVVTAIANLTVVDNTTDNNDNTQAGGDDNTQAGGDDNTQAGGNDNTQVGDNNDTTVDNESGKDSLTNGGTSNGSGTSGAEKTGDTTNVWGIVAGMLVALGLGVAVTCRKKEGNCETR